MIVLLIKTNEMMETGKDREHLLALKGILFWLCAVSGAKNIRATY